MKAIMTAFALLFLSPGLFCRELTGEDIINRANEIFNPDTTYARMKMTIVTSSGNERAFIYDSWSKNKGEKNLVRYIEPGRVKDQAVLMLNNANDIWVFFPRTQRVRKLATHAKKQKMEGSDFSYEDMGGGDAFIKDYSAKRIEDEKFEGFDCYRLELTRKPGSDLSYSRIILWIIKDNYLTLRIDYYGDKDPSRLEKRLTQSDVRMIDGIPTAMKTVMKNIDDDAKTEIELLEVKFNVILDDSLFSERELKK